MSKTSKNRDKHLKSKHRKKLFKYIEENNKSKFKSYIRKYEIDVKSASFGNAETLMHQACFKGADSIMRYLLKKGVSLTVTNDRRETPLHRACRYLLNTTNEHAYSDLIQPLMNASAEAFHCPDRDGITPQDILDVWKDELARVKNSEKLQGGYETSSNEDSDSSESADDGTKWSERLRDETEAEYATNWGTYEHDFYHEYDEETYKDWGDRIAREHREKHRRNYHFHDRHTNSKKQKCDDEAEEARKEAFQRKLEKEHNEYIERIKQARKEREIKSMIDLKETYELQCKRLFHESKNVRNIGYSDIPWPYRKETGIKGMKDFLLCDINQSDTKTLKKYLRDQQVRWHPDKFVQKCRHLLDENQREKIMKRVNQVSQELNRVIDEVLGD